eukprot:364001-Chlamydomonas_euryale.AAC.4
MSRVGCGGDGPPLDGSAGKRALARTSRKVHPSVMHMTCALGMGTSRPAAWQLPRCRSAWKVHRPSARPEQHCYADHSLDLKLTHPCDASPESWKGPS